MRHIIINTSNTYKIMYKDDHGRIHTIKISDTDEMCAQLTAILNCNVREIIRVEKI